MCPLYVPYSVLSLSEARLVFLSSVLVHSGSLYRFLVHGHLDLSPWECKYYSGGRYMIERGSEIVFEAKNTNEI